MVGGQTEFGFQQLILAPKPAAIAGQRAICPGDPVAGDKDRDGVGTIGAGHGADGFGAVEDRREVAVALPCPCRDGLQRGPDLLLKGRARLAQRNIEPRLCAVEEACELRLHLVDHIISPERQPAVAVFQKPLQRFRQTFAIDELEQM